MLIYKTLFFSSHYSGQWRFGTKQVVCNPRCNIQNPCPNGYFCNRITGDPEDFGKCIKEVNCPRTPFLSNGILSPDTAGVLGHQATFSCPQNDKFIMIDARTGSELTANKTATGSVSIKCTDRGWKLADGSNGDVPACVFSKCKTVFRQLFFKPNLKRSPNTP